MKNVIRLSADNANAVNKLVQDSNNPLLTAAHAANFSVEAGLAKVRSKFVLNENKPKNTKRAAAGVRRARKSGAGVLRGGLKGSWTVGCSDSPDFRGED